MSVYSVSLGSVIGVSAGNRLKSAHGKARRGRQRSRRSAQLLLGRGAIGRINLNPDRRQPELLGGEEGGTGSHEGIKHHGVGPSFANLRHVNASSTG